MTLIHSGHLGSGRATHILESQSQWTVVEKHNSFIILSSCIETLPLLCVVVGSWDLHYFQIPCHLEYANVPHRTLPNRCALSQPPVPLGECSRAGVGDNVYSSEGRSGLEIQPDKGHWWPRSGCLVEAYFSERKKNWLRWSRDGEGLRAVEPQVSPEELCLEVGGRRCPVAQRLAVSGGRPCCW